MSFDALANLGSVSDEELRSSNGPLAGNSAVEPSPPLMPRGIRALEGSWKAAAIPCREMAPCHTIAQLQNHPAGCCGLHLPDSARYCWMRI